MATSPVLTCEGDRYGPLQSGIQLCVSENASEVILKPVSPPPKKNTSTDGEGTLKTPELFPCSGVLEKCEGMKRTILDPV